MIKCALLLLLAVQAISSQDLPGVYDFYSEGGISSGLTENGQEFHLNGKLLHILSGAIHYFRVPPEYWRDRLRKLRATGFNTVETYVAWSLHEKSPDNFDFTGWLDVRKYIEIAKEEDLLVILRPGPFMCSEFDFGGLPPWLLKDPDMKVRSSYEPYQKRASIYLKALLSQMKDLQWSSENGAQPIIAMQVENEYGAFGFDDQPRDTDHLRFLLNEMNVTNEMSSVLYFTSDSPSKTSDLGSIPGILQTINFRTGGEKEFKLLDELQPGRPKMVAEYWTGWFDHWTVPFHAVTSLRGFEKGVTLSFTHNASINLYMFIGGTNYGFLSGGNMIDFWPHYWPTSTSYDYDAPLTEWGDYTDKYHKAAELVEKYNRGPTLRKPEMPEQSIKVKYEPVKFTQYMTLKDFVSQSAQEKSDKVINMEALPNHPQNRGYIVYTQQEIHLPKDGATLKIEGHVRDIAFIVVDGQLINHDRIKTLLGIRKDGYWTKEKSEFKLEGDDAVHRLDIVVEALGRNNYGRPDQFLQRKGLYEGQVYLNDELLNGWSITPLEFQSEWLAGLTGWKQLEAIQSGPHLVKATFDIDDPNDTFLDMTAQGSDTWVKGAVFVNGLNLGRYWNVGPTKTMFLAAPHLKKGTNEIIIFELYESGMELCFTDTPDLGFPLSLG